MRAILVTIVTRDLRLAYRQASDTIAALLFFVLCTMLFPLALGPSPDLLRRIAPGILWVCALVATMPPLDRIFSSDQQDGTLDAMMLSGVPLGLIGLAKIIGHWVTTGLPLMLIAAPISLMLGIQGRTLPTLMLSLALGTPLLSLVGGMIAAIILGARRGVLILPLLTLPLVTPVVIFGASMVYRAQYQLSPGPESFLMGACLLIALPCCSYATGAALRVATQD